MVFIANSRLKYQMGDLKRSTEIMRTWLLRFILFVSLLVCSSCERMLDQSSRLDISEKNKELTIIDKKSGFVFTIVSDNEASVGYHFTPRNVSVTLKKDQNGYKELQFMVIGKDESMLLIDNEGRDAIWDQRLPEDKIPSEKGSFFEEN